MPISAAWRCTAADSTRLNMEAGSCEKPMTAVSLPSDIFQSSALLVAYSVGEVLMPSSLLLQASASTRWNSGSETMSLANSFWKVS